MSSDDSGTTSRRERVSRMGNLRAETIKLGFFVLAAVFLLGYLAVTLARKKSSPADLKVGAPEPAQVKTDVLPFEGPVVELTEGQDGLPFGPEVLEKVDHSSRALEWEPYFYLANYVMKRSAADLRREALPDVRWRDVYNDPDKYEGKVLRVTGSLARLRVAPLPDSNPCNLKEVYQGQIIDKYFRFWTFILTEKPPKAIRKDDTVRVYGTFFKIWEYETNMPNARKLTAVIVGKNFVQVEIDKTPAMGKTIAALTLLTVVILLFAVRWDRAKDREIKGRRLGKLRGQRPESLNEMAKTLSGRVAEERAALFEPRKRTSRDADDAGKVEERADGDAEAGNPVPATEDDAAEDGDDGASDQTGDDGGVDPEADEEREDGDGSPDERGKGAGDGEDEEKAD